MGGCDLYAFSKTLRLVLVFHFLILAGLGYLCYDEYSVQNDPDVSKYTGWCYGGPFPGLYPPISCTLRKNFITRLKDFIESALFLDKEGSGSTIPHKTCFYMGERDMCGKETRFEIYKEESNFEWFAECVWAITYKSLK